MSGSKPGVCLWGAGQVGYILIPPYSSQHPLWMLWVWKSQLSEIWETQIQRYPAASFRCRREELPAQGESPDLGGS